MKRPQGNKASAQSASMPIDVHKKLNTEYRRALKNRHRCTFFIFDLIIFALNRTKMKEIVFIVEESQDGSYFARAVNQSIVTQGSTLAELKSMIGDAVHCHFETTNLPNLIHLHGTHKETYAL